MAEAWRAMVKADLTPCPFGRLRHLGKICQAGAAIAACDLDCVRKIAVFRRFNLGTGLASLPSE